MPTTLELAGYGTTKEVARAASRHWQKSSRALGFTTGRWACYREEDETNGNAKFSVISLSQTLYRMPSRFCRSFKCWGHAPVRELHPTRRLKMNPFDDLPKRDRNREIEEKAEAAFQKLISQSEDFIFQGADRKDYGTDCQIELVHQKQLTNVRVHVQLKGTENALKTDGSVSAEISRTNLNYLLAQPHSFYVSYHVPSDSLRVRFVENVLRQYEHSGRSWTKQKTLTVSFSEVLTVDRLKALAALARASSASSRDRRIEQVSATVDDVPGVLKRSVAEVHVPENAELANQVLQQLYENGADANISAAFDTFAAVLGLDHDVMGNCYMAEINLGMAGRSQQPGRI